MKKFIKLLPAAVALVALSSCSNEDLFSGAQETNYTKTLEVTHEGINDFTVTRSSMVPTDGNKVLYDANDVIRVYDESITLFDKYVFDGTKFGTTGTNVSDAKYAIFPSEQVKWGDSEGDPKVAVVIKDEVDLSSTVNGATVEGQKAFVANIPAWGIVKEGATTDKLEVSLYDMTGIIRVAIQQLDGNMDGNRLIVVSDNDKTSSTLVDGDGVYKNITGAFSATLDKNIASTKGNTTTQLGLDATLAGGNRMVIELGTEKVKDAYVYLPIVAGTYEAGDVAVYLQKGNDAINLVKRFAANSGTNRVFKRGGVYDGGVIGENTVEVSESDPYNIQAIIEANKNKGMDVTVDVAYKDEVSLATSNNADAKNHTITIPADLNNNIVLNIKTTGTTNHDITAKPLTITGGKAGKTVTFNFVNNKVVGADAAAEKANGDANSGIVIDSKSDIVLTGKIETSIDVRSTNTGKVTLGTTADAFTWATTAGSKNLVFKGGDLTVENIASITAIDYAATGTVTVNAPLTTSLTANTTGVTPTAVNVNANVTTVTTKAAKINVTGATVENLNAEYGAEDITLVDGKVTNLGATGGYTAAKTVNVASSGISAITNVTIPFNCTYAYTSTWDIPTTKTIDDVKTGVTLGAGNKIYTAAQLVKAVDGAQLMTDVTFAANSLTFVGATLEGGFDGNKKTITGLTGPLFFSVKGADPVIQNLTLKNVSIITNANKVGALMKTNSSEGTGTLTLKNIVVDGGTIGSSSALVQTEGIGGLIGTNGRNVIFDGCQVTATIKGYACVGGFIGYSIANATSLTIEGKKLSNVTFAKTYSATTYNDTEKKQHGTFGNFIGQVRIATGTITINVGAAAAENALSGYFTNNIVPSALEFNVNKVTVAGVDKSFVGMSGNYIGYSPYTSNGLTINYNGLSGVTRQDATHSEINVFQ